MHTGSPFFDRFSLRELIEKNYPWARSNPSGAGGAIGGGSIGRGKSSYHKSETFACPIPLSGDDRFYEPQFIGSLRSLIEKEIIDSGAAISAQGAPDTAAFYFEYRYEDLNGRIDVSGGSSISGYVLRAEVNEKGEGIARPSERAALMQPQGDHYIVGVTQKDSFGKYDSLIETGRRLIKESLDRMRHTISKQGLESLQYAEIFTLLRLPPHIKRAIEDGQIELDLDLIADSWKHYEEYQQVYFLNETAVRMYRDAGIELEILEKISAADMPKQCHRQLRGPYVPKE